MGSLTNRTEVIPGPKCSLTASSSVSKVKFPTKAVKGGTVGTGSSSRGGPEKPESTDTSVKFLMNTWWTYSCFAMLGQAWNQGSLILGMAVLQVPS
jgi:hypothetical protein